MIFKHVEILQINEQSKIKSNFPSLPLKASGFRGDGAEKLFLIPLTDTLKTLHTEAHTTHTHSLIVSFSLTCPILGVEKAGHLEMPTGIHRSS